MDTELKEKVIAKRKNNSRATKAAQEKKKKFSEKLPSFKSASKIAGCFLFAWAICTSGYNIYGYFKNKSMISEHAEKCSKYPSYENCSAQIIDASKAGKNAAGIVDGAGKQSFKQ